MPAQVENLLLEAGELLPDSPQAAFNLALKTLDLLEFQRDEPLLARVHMIAGVACQRLGQHALAIEHLIESRRLMLDLVDQRGQLEVGLELSRAYRSLGQLAEAGECLNFVLQFSRECTVPAFEAEALNGLAAISHALGDTAHSLERIEQALGLFRELCDLRGQVNSINNIGIIQTQRGNYVAALDALATCHDLIQTRLPDPDLQVNCLINIGNVHQEMQQFSNAIAQYQQALDLARTSGLWSLEVMALTNMAETFILSNEVEQAVALYQEVLARSRSLGSPIVELDALEGLARSEIKLGRPEQSLDLIDQGLALSRSTGERFREVQLLLDLGDVHSSLQNQDAALEAFDSAKALAGPHDSMRLLLEAELRISTLLETSGDFHGAFMAYRVAHKIERKLFNQHSDRRLQSLNTQFELSRSQAEADALRQRSEEIQQINAQLESRVRQRTRDLEVAQLETVTRLAYAAEYRDDTTGRHTYRVGHLSALLAEAAGLNLDQVAQIKIAARLHDVGKIGIPDQILLKTGKLDPEEYGAMQAHTLIGARILSGGHTPVLQMAENIALNHHERWDGLGYPNGLSGDAIPMIARLVSVADVYDALTSSRPYKHAWSSEEAMLEIERQSGKMFDPRIVTHLRSVIPQHLRSLEHDQSMFKGTVLTDAPEMPAANRDVQADTASDNQASLSLVVLELNLKEPIRAEQHFQIDETLTSAWEERSANLLQSRERSQQALLDSISLSYQRGIGLAQRNLGFHHFMNSEFEQAIRSLSDGLECAKELRDPLLTRDCLNYLGAVYSSLGEYTTSIGHVQSTIDLCTQAQDRAGMASALTNLGLLNYHLGNNEEAIRCHQESLSLSRELGDQTREMMALNNLGIALTNLNRDEEAIVVLKQVLALAAAIGNPIVRARALVNLGEVHLRQAKLETALNLSVEGRDLFHASSNHEGESHALFSIGLVHVSRQDQRLAIKVFEAGLRIAMQIGSKHLAYQFHQHLASAHETLGQPAEALRHYMQYHTLEREVQADQIERKMRASNAQREVERSRAESELYRLRNTELAQVLSSLQEADVQKSKLLEALNQKSDLLERQVKEDALTGVYNRRYLELRLSEEFQRCRESELHLSVIMLDIDHFKRINDCFSHQLGDQVIKKVAQLIVQSSRSGDLVARYGGEEFVVAMPQLSAAKAFVICERIRKAVEGFDWAQLEPELRVTISAGLSDNPSVDNHERLLHAADLNLYKAKNAGRNRTQV